MSSYTYDLPVVAPGYTGSGANITLLNANALSSGHVPKDRGRAGDSIDTGVLAFNGTTKEAGMLYSGTGVPDSTNRLNYDGHIHATKFVGNGSDLTGLPGGSATGKKLDLYSQWETNNVSTDEFITVIHDLGTQNLLVQVWWNNGGDYDLVYGVGVGISNLPGFMGVRIVDNNTVRVKLNDSPDDLLWSVGNYFIHIIPFTV